MRYPGKFATGDGVSTEKKNEIENKLGIKQRSEVCCYLVFKRTSLYLFFTFFETKTLIYSAKLVEHH